EIIQEKISRLESLKDSLSSQQASYAGYGFPSTGGDLERVRNALYEAKAQKARLVARKVYLQHRIQSEGALEPGETAYTSETVEDKSTEAPENCPIGAVNVRGKWHCLKRQTLNKAPQKEEKKSETCDLGTVELHGKTYCLGMEPGGPLVQEASSNFLGALLNRD
ncbi:MAG: hypothetical protein KDD39_10575, partial [Bdellovibrionales bacterium]|nr:hypothetical protein [Bdellovibrionales bacterium]